MSDENLPTLLAAAPVFLAELIELADSARGLATWDLGCDPREPIDHGHAAESLMSELEHAAGVCFQDACGRCADHAHDEPEARPRGWALDQHKNATKDKPRC